MIGAQSSRELRLSVTKQQKCLLYIPQKKSIRQSSAGRANLTKVGAVAVEEGASKGEAVAKRPMAAPPKMLRYSSVQLETGFWCLQGTYEENQMVQPEVQYRLKAGSTHNSYIFKGGEEVIVVDPSAELFKDAFIAEMTAKARLQEITHVVITQLNGKMLPTLQAILERCQQIDHRITLVLSNPALQQLQIKLGGSPDAEAPSPILGSADILIVKQGTKLPLGRSYLLLLPTPTPRWPDLFTVYSPTHSAMLTSCLFASHVLPVQPPPVPARKIKAELSKTEDDEVDFPELQTAIDVTDRSGGWGAYYRHWKYYFDCMLAPVARQAQTQVEKLALRPPGGFLGFWGKLWRTIEGQLVTLEREVKYLAPVHGPVITSSVAQVLLDYNTWLNNAVAISNEYSIALFYASAYGNTSSLALALSRGVTKAGVGVEIVDLETASLDDVSKVLKSSKGFLVGSPTLGGHMPTQVQAALGQIIKDAASRKLPCGVFGSYGWSGEAVDEVDTRLKDAGFRMAFDSIKVKFTPTQGQLQLCEESGTDLAQLVLKKAQQQARATGAAPQATDLVADKEKAMGRVVGCMCVITTQDDDASGAMLASWVAQASFNPPGLTFALKKDRAMDSLLTIGSPFVVNILPEGNDRPIAKALLKPFKPGQDRFGELETVTDEATGIRILSDACSVLKCTLASRMDAGDHWVVYGKVGDGYLQDASVNSAVHHRKVGTYY